MTVDRGDRRTATLPRRVHRRLHRAANHRHTLAIHLLVFIGGSTGALARYGLSEMLPPAPNGWPWPTFIANLLGALALGAIAAWLAEGRPPAVYRLPLLATGLCGALTTFSTMQIEALTLADSGRWATAVAYPLTSIVAGLAGVVLAARLVRALTGRTAR
ncbi:MAG TPA: fluoride efflux transporter CrcB [Miltoncostaeaceae bacterium]|nr:fluoride efflux transporter CrcB [Miltoncostaeaceae bacterium]